MFCSAWFRSSPKEGSSTEVSVLMVKKSWLNTALSTLRIGTFLFTGTEGCDLFTLVMPVKKSRAAHEISLIFWLRS